MIAAGVHIEPTATIEDHVTIGEGSSIWHQAHLRSGCSIGSDTSVGKNVFVDVGVTVGSRVKIQNNVSVFRGVSVADEVFLGPSCVFTNDLLPRATGTDWTLVETSVERGASVGANATIVCGVTLGRSSMIGAGAVVTHDVAANQLVLGNPARPSGWVCACGAVVSRVAWPRPERLSCDSCSPQRRDVVG